MAESDDRAAAAAGGAAYWRYLLIIVARKRWSVPAALSGAGIILANVLPHVHF